MQIRREILTPMVGGAFLISAVTGVLMFFHADTGLNKAAHEWLGFFLLVVVVLHISTNMKPLKKALATQAGRITLVGLVLVLCLTFLPLSGEGGGKKPFIPAIEALANAPLPVLAQVAKTTPDDMRARLERAGMHPTADTQTVNDLAGPEFGRQMHVLRAVLSDN